MDGSEQLTLPTSGTIPHQATSVAASNPPGTRRDAAIIKPAPARSPYLTTDDVAQRLRCSRRSVHELTRTAAIPHRRAPGSRRCLFLEAELAAWLDGAPLDVHELPRGGRVVKPLTTTSR